MKIISTALHINIEKNFKASLFLTMQFSFVQVVGLKNPTKIIYFFVKFVK